MNRYLVFSGYQFNNTGGGWEDFKSSHETFESAIAEADRLCDNGRWSHVVDITTETVVYESATTGVIGS